MQQPTAEPQQHAGLPLTFAQVEMALRMVPVDRLREVYDYLLDLQDEAADVAAMEAARGEPTVSLDQVLAESGLTREQLEEIARSEGWLR